MAWGPRIRGRRQPRVGGAGRRAEAGAPVAGLQGKQREREIQGKVPEGPGKVRERSGKGPGKAPVAGLLGACLRATALARGRQPKVERHIRLRTARCSVA